MSEEIKAKLLQFLSEEVELLEDFGMDVDAPDANNRQKAQAVAHYAAQVARVGAIRDVLEMVGVSERGM